MDGEAIRELLASIAAPSDLPIPVPPNMCAIPVAAVVDAGGDPAEVETWVRSVLGWPKRVPPMFAAPDASELDLMYFIVPDRELEGARAPAVSLGGEDLIAFVPTTDMSRARPFYERTLGLVLEGDSPVACAFRVNGVLLRVIVVERLTPYPFTVLGWSVRDIVATVAGLTARGVAFERIDGIEQDELGIWRSPGGARVAWFKDPDANTLSLTQF
ncbi:MAG: VOC family protein [Solirubrobacteraceae bacterium]|nr:VOC family protein [Solirubrobacteraceae bacterium]